MRKIKQLATNPRFIVGIIIAVHGLLRIVFINKYIDFVLSNFNDFLPSEVALTIGSALFPFVEFFVGLLLIYNVSIKHSTWLGILISIVMSVFIIAAQMYTRLIYHIIIVAMLTIVLMQAQLHNTGNNLLEGAKSKIDPWSKYFF